MTATSSQDQTLREAARTPAAGRRLAVALWCAAGLCILGGGLLLWRDRAELVFLDMVASALAMCF